MREGRERERERKEVEGKGVGRREGGRERKGEEREREGERKREGDDGGRARRERVSSRIVSLPQELPPQSGLFFAWIVCHLEYEDNTAVLP